LMQACWHSFLGCSVDSGRSYKARQEYRERSVFLNTAAIALLAERIMPEMDQGKPIFDLKNGRKIWEWVRAQIGRPDVRCSMPEPEGPSPTPDVQPRDRTKRPSRVVRVLKALCIMILTSLGTVRLLEAFPRRPVRFSLRAPF